MGRRVVLVLVVALPLLAVVVAGWGHAGGQGSAAAKEGALAATPAPGTPGAFAPPGEIDRGFRLPRARSIPASTSAYRFSTDSTLVSGPCRRPRRHCRAARAHRPRLPPLPAGDGAVTLAAWRSEMHRWRHRT